MNSRTLLRARNSLYVRSIRRIVQLASRELGQPVDRALVERVARATFATVRGTRTMARDIAYRDYLGFVANRDPVPKLELNRFTEELWIASVEKHLRHPETDELTGNLDEDRVQGIGLSSDYWSKDAEWGQRVDSAKKDPRIWRVARVDYDPPSCPFCTLLNSRGPVYLTMDTGARTLHIGDQCSLVFVEKGQTDYPGRESTVLAEKAYIAARKAAPAHSGTPGVLKELAAAHEHGEGVVQKAAREAATEGKKTRVKQVTEALRRVERSPASSPRVRRARAETASRYRDVLKTLEGQS